MKQILIAHQSTIPHYRIPFYNALERLRPDSWRFDVVFDPNEIQNKKYFKETLDTTTFTFPTLETRTITIKLSDKTISYQTFWRKAGQYDLIIVENAVNNLTYPICHLHKLNNVKIAYWGHGKDHSVNNRSIPKLVSEQLKLLLVRLSDGFFAYTQGVKLYLEREGINPEKVFVVNNSIDITEQRKAFEKLLPSRSTIKQEYGMAGKKVLLFVGRFTQNKRSSFLLEAFSILHSLDNNFHLLLVGSGGEAYSRDNPENITYLGSIVELDKLSPIYVISDIFCFPGAVGLGPLQALCYDLPVITIDSPNHMPEIEYLSPDNSIILGASTSPQEYAHTIYELFNNSIYLSSFKASVWPSIKHLTIDQMANNFISGINTLLDS